MRNLPQGNPTGTYDCYINNIKVPSILIGNVLECLAPNSSQLPFANYQTGNSCLFCCILYCCKTWFHLCSPYITMWVISSDSGILYLPELWVRREVYFYISTICAGITYLLIKCVVVHVWDYSNSLFYCI